MPSPASRRGSLLRWFVLLLVLVGAVWLIAALVHWPDRVATSAPPTEPIEVLPFKPKEVPPLRAPDTLPPPDSNVSPDDLVVGVAVNGVHRAYLLKAFAEIDRHVLNDLLAGQPITVTHCPETSCTRVFTGPAGSRLQMRVGGRGDQVGGYRMVLRVGRQDYYQDSGRAVSGDRVISHPTMDHQLTTWGKWREQYPDTDLYSGGAEVGY